MIASSSASQNLKLGSNNWYEGIKHRVLCKCTDNDLEKQRCLLALPQVMLNTDGSLGKKYQGDPGVWLSDKETD